MIAHHPNGGQARAKKNHTTAEEEKEKERARRVGGQETVKSKRELEEQQRKRDMEARKREKREFELERQRHVLPAGDFYEPVLEAVNSLACIFQVAMMALEVCPEPCEFQSFDWRATAGSRSLLTCIDECGRHYLAKS